ncbi:hypothetical protein ACF061_15895 [Streptomyces sp. NPDC015220]|uniref:hypothetical protein n=1 Tax=Streptomyces sp. NPDC015220 TaxID=3364947 RepID=UPI0036F5D500
MDRHSGGHADRDRDRRTAIIDEGLPRDRAREGFARLASGEHFGKIVPTDA